MTIVGAATFSDDRVYRYTLDRQIGGPNGKMVTWILLNPSTATAEKDDPTIRRCTSWSRTWGYAKMRILNVYAFRATDPRKMLAAKDPVGPENDKFIRESIAASDLIVLAWGTKGGDRARQVAMMAHSSRKQVACLAMTKDGHPRHPLYLAADTKLKSLAAENGVSVTEIVRRLVAQKVKPRKA